MLGDFSFEYPYILLLIVVFIALERYFKTQNNAYYIPHLYETLPHVSKKYLLKTFLKWLLVVSTLVALASPIVIRGEKLQETPSIDIVLSLDSSGSMSLTGFNALHEEQSRWNVVKEVVKDFIKKREKDRIGLVLFGSTTAIASPLSDAKEAQLSIVDAVELGVVGKSTALIDGLTAAVGLLKKSKKQSKVIVLLSDGEDTASVVPLAVALKFAKKHEVKVYTVAIDEGRSNILKLIAKENAGKNFYANSKEDLYEIYRTIDTLERTATPDKKVKIIDYYAFYFMAVALAAILLLLMMIKVREDL